jgi:probable HAF family extracellular repeat protein
LVFGEPNAQSGEGTNHLGEDEMKPEALKCATLLAAMVVLAVFLCPAAQSQTEPHNSHVRYFVKALSTLGGTQGGANTVTDSGWVEGWATLPGDQTEHGVLWRGHTMTDLGTLGGPNSASSFPGTNTRGLIVGNSQTAGIDPFGEDFCTFSLDTAYLCQGFRWQNGQMSALPTLGGNNSWATGVNHRSQIAGFAETTTQDPSCVPPQAFDYEAVVWGPKQGEIREFPPFSGDTISAATYINDNEQVVGCSGACAQATPAACTHALLWQHGSVTDLGSLGGVMNNLALFVNNRGDVVGASDLQGDATAHGFLWSRDDGMQDLGTLPGDFSTFAVAINDEGQVVGQSCDQSGNCRAFFWQGGVMTDLNALVLPGSSLYLTGASDINNRGEIAGYAYDPDTGDTPAFLAIPCDEHHADVEGCKNHASDATPTSGQRNAPTRVILPAEVREQLRQKRAFGHGGARMFGAQ